jgi:hypothetical protein
MFILDTNVISELMKMKPDQRVFEWVGQAPANKIFITAINQAEILYGIMLLPVGKRRKAFESAAQEVFEQNFAGRILSFNPDAAAAYAQIASDRSRAGHPISHLDAQIAAIAHETGAALVTRNIKDFHGCSINLINPWL